jgi:hypothetical protein
MLGNMVQVQISRNSLIDPCATQLQRGTFCVVGGFVPTTQNHS